MNKAAIIEYVLTVSYLKKYNLMPRDVDTAVETSLQRSVSKAYYALTANNSYSLSAVERNKTLKLLTLKSVVDDIIERIESELSAQSAHR